MLSGRRIPAERLAWLISVLMNAVGVACSYRFDVNADTEAAICLSRDSPDEENWLVLSEAAVISFVEFMIMVIMTSDLVRQDPKIW